MMRPGLQPRPGYLSTKGRLLVAVVMLVMFAPLEVYGAGLAPRSIQVGSSGQGVTTSYTVNATTATGDDIGSVKFEFCTTATGACALPSGMLTTSATLTAQNPNGFTMVNTTNGAPYIGRVPATIGASTAMSFTLGNIVNPSTPNQSYYVRITTYTGSDGVTGPVDTGTVALSTAQPIQLTGVTPEILVFCVGKSIPGNCSTATGNSIDFGDFDPLQTRYDTSEMQAMTNAAFGYSITVNGTTLASGANTITALAGQTASAVGGPQFGLNLRANTTPGVGADIAGGGTGQVNANYNTQNQYRFNSGDVVASAGAPTNANTYTSSYIVNIGGSQAAGVYTATMTYICTASF